jgi:hypothetical protein
VDVQGYSYNTNFVGNVLGFQGQTLLSYNSNCYTVTQTSWQYDNLSTFAPDILVTMWSMGADQSHQAIDGNWAWVPTTYQTQLRQGNWDWFTKSQQWHGIGGPAGSGTPQPIPNSLYLTSKPAFFGSNPWPWVDPSTGLVSTLPAKARFARIRSGTSVTPTNTHDFNGDGKSDIVWRDTGGNAAVWLMNGAQITQSAVIGAAPTVWSIVGQRDFNGDGKYDILWHDTSGNMAMWLMNGVQVTQSAGVGNISTAWTIVGTADFDGDGKGDILWHDPSGNVAMWLMNGAQITQSVGVGNVSTVWTIVGTGDFNGDGKSDILWQDTSGNVAMWLMNGAQITQSVGVGNLSTVWSIQGANAD